MSISSEISRISGNVSDALTAIGNKGVTVPQWSTSDDLATLIGSIQTGGGGMTLDWADVQEITIGPNSVTNAANAQTYLSSFTFTFLILKDAVTVNNQLVFAASNDLGKSLKVMYRCRNNVIGQTAISTSYDYKLVEGSVYYAITKKTS